MLQHGRQYNNMTLKRIEYTLSVVRFKIISTIAVNDHCQLILYDHALLYILRCTYNYVYKPYLFFETKYLLGHVIIISFFFEINHPENINVVSRNKAIGLPRFK